MIATGSVSVIGTGSHYVAQPLLGSQSSYFSFSSSYRPQLTHPAFSYLSNGHISCLPSPRKLPALRCGLSRLLLLIPGLHLPTGCPGSFQDGHLFRQPCYIAQAIHKLMILLPLLPSAGTTGVIHQAWLHCAVTIPHPCPSFVAVEVPWLLIPGWRYPVHPSMHRHRVSWPSFAIWCIHCLLSLDLGRYLDSCSPSTLSRLQAGGGPSNSWLDLVKG